MLSEVRHTIDGLLARAGLTGVRASVVKAAIGLAAVAVVFALVKGTRAPAVEFGYDDDVTSTPAASQEATAQVDAVIVVHVAGCVRSPGVYRLPDGSRVDDAIRQAGGALGEAAPDALNLARILTDGEQVYVPSVDELESGERVSSRSDPGTGQGTSGLVDLNTATVAELDELPGIGPSTAQKIVDDRTANGPYTSVDDLVRVSGIGSAKVESLRDLVTTG